MSRTRTLLLAALALPALGAPAADAAELTYVDHDNVYVENVDGSQRHALSTDGTAARPYQLPSADQHGNLAAFQLSADGARQEIVYWPGGAGTPVRNPMSRMPGDTSNTPPLSARMQPDWTGTTPILGYTFHAFGDPAEPRAGRVDPSSPGPTFAASRWSDLTWHRERPLVSEDGVLYWTGRTQPLADARGDGFDITFGELSADGTRWLIRMRDRTTGATTLDLFAFKGQLGTGSIEDGCHIPVGAGFQRGALSRDGKTVAWEDAAGVHVAQANPFAYETGSELCTLTGKRTVSSSARMPSFSDASTVAPPPPPGPPSGGGGGGTTTTTGGGTTTTTKPGGGTTTTTKPGGDAATSFRVTLPKAVRASALRRGLALKAAAPGAGKVTLTLRRGKKAIASGSATAKQGGTVTVKLKARKGAGRLTGATKLTSTFTPAGGGAKVTRTVTVRVR